MSIAYIQILNQLVFHALKHAQITVAKIAQFHAVPMHLSVCCIKYRAILLIHHLSQRRLSDEFSIPMHLSVCCIKYRAIVHTPSVSSMISRWIWYSDAFRSLHAFEHAWIIELKNTFYLWYSDPCWRLMRSKQQEPALRHPLNVA